MAIRSEPIANSAEWEESEREEAQNANEKGGTRENGDNSPTPKQAETIYDKV